MDELRSQINDKQGLCLLYTSDAADERSSVDLGGRRIIKKKKNQLKSAADSIQQTLSYESAKTRWQQIE